MDIAYLIGVIIGAVVVGGLVGAVPLICGLIKKRTGLAIGGMAACLIGHFILGLIISVPLCILFVLLIFLTKKKDNTPENQPPVFTA